ncbi:MAG: GH1 family beta-glucosidase [Chloroflexota bacterium]|nr:GH1 family beta-glucosidase [Chloroflexota bacterium]
MTFPADFAWGSATASYQVEGAAFEDGRGYSVWDMISRKKKLAADGDAAWNVSARKPAVYNGHTGDVACDHYHRYRDDVALMKQIGLKAYRFSVSWSRVIPDGVGAVNEKGLAFYDSLVDELLGAGIDPWLTLFHWDYPYELYCRGGWLNPDSPKWFADYAAVIVERLSDRVSHWMTLNEPQCFIGLGHDLGTHAPGDMLGLREVLRAGHNALLAHGMATQVIRAQAKTAPLVGWAPVGVVSVPATESEADIAAARIATFSALDRPLWSNTWWSDPVVFGQYPEDLLAIFADAAPVVGADDMATIQQPLDFYGCNIYSAAVVRAGADGQPVKVEAPVGAAITLMGWSVVPDALYWGARFLQERYKAPIIITENGISVMDWVSADGGVHDPARIDYMARYLSALKRASSEGVDIRGYFHWSLMDNFEWLEGYKQRFGMIYVDFQTQQRTLKDSAHWYSAVIANNGADLDDVPSTHGDL